MVLQNSAFTSSILPSQVPLFTKLTKAPPKARYDTTTDFFVGFWVLKLVAMKISIFWDITPCCSAKTNRRFGVTHLQGRIICQNRNLHEADSACYTVNAGFLLDFDLEEGGNMFLQNIGLYSPGCMALCHRRQNSSCLVQSAGKQIHIIIGYKCII
jgi:hypothetical protein